jgi:hypothetical protein
MSFHIKPFRFSTETDIEKHEESLPCHQILPIYSFPYRKDNSKLSMFKVLLKSKGKEIIRSNKTVAAIFISEKR